MAKMTLNLISVLGLLVFPFYVEGALQTFNLTLSAGWAAPDGYWRQVFLINDQFPGPLIEVDEGDDILVNIQNNLPVDNSIHWHGLVQNGTAYSDGVPGVTQYPILPGGNLTLQFSTAGQYGFFWYHSHTRGYYADGVRGPLLIRPSPSRARPYASLADNVTATLADLIAVEQNATTLFVHDWYHVTSDTLIAMYYTTGVYPSCFDSIVFNGKGAVQCLPMSVLEEANPPSPTMTETATVTLDTIMTSAAGPMTDMEIATATADAMQMGSGPMGGIIGGGMGNTDQMGLSPRGCSQPMMFKDGYDASYLNPEVCVNTSTPLETIYTNGASWISFNIVNAAVVTGLSFSLDSHSLWVFAADGPYVEPQKVEVLNVAVGQRYAVFVELNQTPGSYYFRASATATGDMVQIIQGQAILVYGTNTTNTNSSTSVPLNNTSTYMFLNGTAMPGATPLNESALAPFPAYPPPQTADYQYFFTINQTEPTEWQINLQPFEDPVTPILFGNVSDGWISNTTYFVPSNASVVDIILSIAPDSLDTMGHPLHLHGHTFWTLGSGTGNYDASQLNLVNPPVKDTELIPADGWLWIRYIADNPGAWIFHCHLDWHLVAGMAVVIVEGENSFPTIPANVLQVPSFQ